MKKSLYQVLICVIIFSVLSCVALRPSNELEAYTVDSTEHSPISFSEHYGLIKYVGKGFKVSEFTDSVKKGETAKISVSSDDKAEISISAYYSSGKSSSEVFMPKTAQCGEDAVWQWRVPTNTTSERIRIVLRSNDTYAILYIHIF